MGTKRNLLLGIAILFSVKAVTTTCDAMNLPTDTVPGDTTLMLQEVSVKPYFLDPEKTPLTMTMVSQLEMRRNVTAAQYIDFMKGIGGVYATAETGSFGDAKLNIRGFKQDNIAIMLNGIPIQGLTSGSMYWSNWMGLSDATHSVQIQKGIGGSMLADCSMGGMVNIITKTSGMSPQTEIGLYATQYGTTKGTLTYSTGLLPKGWSARFDLSYVKGEGYVKATNVEAFSYMFTVSKMFNLHNMLTFVALGSPENHSQRNTRTSLADIERYGTDYNPNWGLLYGKEFSTSFNHYFKPYFTLQHILDYDHFSMKNCVYFASAYGGGRYNETQKKGISQYVIDGQIDFNRVLEENTLWEGASMLSPEHGLAAQNIITDYLSGHKQLGAISTADYRFNEHWKVSGGVQYQLYDTWEKEIITDLLGADFWFEDYEHKALCGQAGRSSIKYVGDEVRTHNGKTTHFASGFINGEFSGEKLVANAGAALYCGFYRRHDEYNYPEGNQLSDWANGWGYSIKSGMLYNVNTCNSFFVNAAYNDRLPYAGAFFASSNNAITKDMKNEKNLVCETGYRLGWLQGGLQLSGYAALWKNKTLTSNKYKQLEDTDAVRYQIPGMNALHLGLELSVRQHLFSCVSARVFASFGQWKWQNDVVATIYDDYTGQPVQEIHLFTKGLHVGDAPQTQLGAALEANLPKGFFLHLGWSYNARMYADFEPASRVADDYSDAFLLPDYHLFDASFSWEHQFSDGVGVSLLLTGKNLSNAVYIERGVDGTDHTLSTFKGYWGAPRIISIGLRLSLQ